MKAADRRCPERILHCQFGILIAVARTRCLRHLEVLATGTTGQVTQLRDAAMGDGNLNLPFRLNGVGAVDRGDMIKFGTIGLDRMVASVT